MPHRHAHWFLLAILALATFAFWRSYLSQFTASPVEFHAHGITATLWILLLIAQSWTIHSGARATHRTLGTLSLILVPLFMAGGATIFLGMARRFAGGLSPFHLMYAPRLAWLDVVAVGGFAYFFFKAMQLRHKVHPHSRYLLATVFFLMPPIIGRILPAFPPLTPIGPDGYAKLGLSFQLANGITASAALAAAARSGRHGKPYILAAALIVLGALLYQFVGATAAWKSVYGQMAELPTAPIAAFAAITGAAIGYAGWVTGRRSPPRSVAVPAE